MLDHPWNIVFLVGFVVYIGIRSEFEKRGRGSEKTRRQIDGLEKSLLSIVMIGALILPVLYLATPLLEFADYRLAPIVPWIGLGVMLIALWMF